MYARLTLLPALRQSAAVNVSQSRCAFSLRSWDVFAYELFPNRLHPCGFVSSTAQQRSTSANHAACFALAFLGRFRIRPVTQSASPLGQVSIPSKLYRRQEHFRWQNLAVNVNQSPASPWDLVLGTFSHTACYPIDFRLLDRPVGQALGVLVRVGCTPCGASTPRLSTSSSLRRLTGLLREKLHLRAGFTLRCFQRLSFPDAATQLHGWRHDWYTVGPSTPVLSY